MRRVTQIATPKTTALAKSAALRRSAIPQLGIQRASPEKQKGRRTIGKTESAKTQIEGLSL